MCDDKIEIWRECNDGEKMKKLIETAILKSIVEHDGLCGNISCDICPLCAKCRVWHTLKEPCTPKLLREAKRIIVDNMVDEELSI